MAKLALQPATTGPALENYEATIENPRPLSDFQPYVSAEVYEEFRSFYQERRVSVWGTTEDNRGTYGKLEPDDEVLFYREGQFISKA